MKLRAYSGPEHLEARIAPATLLKNVLTYTDIDGDTVKITFTTKKTLTTDQFVFDSAFATGGPQQLQTIDLSSDPLFKGAGFIMKVTPGASGDGDAAIGFINATGIDLGSVTIDGDLGRIVAGDATTKTAPIKLLKINSLGALGVTTQEAGGTLDSTLTGAVGKIAVAGSVQEASLRVLGGSDGRIASLTIGGDLQGGAADDSGKFFTEGAVAFVHIAGRIVGAGGANSGRLDFGGKIGKIMVDGDLQGGTGNRAGSILGHAGAGSLLIGGSVKGGASGSSGLIEMMGTLGLLKITGNLEGGGGDLGGSVGVDVLKSATVGGSLLGSAFLDGGGIFAASIGAVKITGNLQGGDGVNSAQIFASGTGLLGGLKSLTIGGSITGGQGFNSALVGAAGTVGTITVTNDVTGGTGPGSGTIFGGSIKAITVKNMTAGTGEASGGVQCDGTLTKLTIKANATGTVDDPLVIAARGGVKKTTTKDLAIGAISIGGNATAVNILAGYRNALNTVTDQLEALNPDAQIGSVTVKGNWATGSIVAGVADVNADGFGNADDAKIAPDANQIVASIAAITIKGTAEGFIGAPAHRFAFTAEKISAVTIGKTKAALKKSTSDDLLVPGAAATDFRIRELP